MLFLETTGFITELWSHAKAKTEFNRVRTRYASTSTSSLVLREFQERVIATLIKLHTVLMAEESEADVIQLLSSDRYFDKMVFQILNEVKMRTGGNWDRNVFLAYIEAVIESEGAQEFHSMVRSISNETRCEVATRGIEKSESGTYFLDTGCRKSQCRCSSATLLALKFDGVSLQKLKESDNDGVKAMIAPLEKFVQGDTKAIQGMKCNTVADLLHVAESSVTGCTHLLTSDRAFPDLSNAIDGPEILSVEAYDPAPRMTSSEKIKKRITSFVTLIKKGK